jgi:hypothetical protein
MTSPDPDIEPLIDALRADLPEPKQAERMRARLFSAGIIAGGVIATPGAAAGSSGLSALSGAGAQAGVVAKAAAVFGGSKVLLAALVVAGSALPVTAYIGMGSPEIAETRAVATAPRTTAAAELPVATPPERALVLPDSTVVATRERSFALPPAPVVPTPRAPAKTANTPPPQAEAAPTKASVATFAPLDQRPAESTLRAETELMDRALSALRSGNHASARSLLKQHATRFPNGTLSPERERALERLNHAELSDASAKER